jgi:hypothetical protein
MRNPEFLDAVDHLLADVATASTVAMCSETFWWRCHRRLIADFLTHARATPVRHLDHDGRTTRHPVAAGAGPPPTARAARPPGRSGGCPGAEPRR